MSDGKRPIRDLIASIADGEPVDWEAAVRAAAPEDRPRVEALGEISRIAAFSRSLQQGGEPFAWAGGGGGAQPERWGDLLLLERLSAGARMEVYRAWDVRLQREVALKLLVPAGTGEGGAAEEALLKEGRAAARIRDPNVVTVYGIGSHDGRTGFWMEYLRGETLDRDVADGGALDPERAARMAHDIGSALVAVHAAGLVHRDVKPANIVHDGSGRYVLTDFGLGGTPGGEGPAEGPSGTPMYMAPELFGGGKPSDRSDIYGLGLALWFALAGRQPFQAGSLPDLIEGVGRGPEPLGAVVHGLPGGLKALVARAISPRPEDRFSSAREFVAAVAAYRDSRSGRARRPLSSRPALLAGIPLVVGIAVVALVLFRPHRSPPVPGAGGSGPFAPPVIGAVSLDGSYNVDASFLRRDAGRALRLQDGDRVRPGDRLSLDVRVSRRAWVYVLNEDDRGERYLLFPQPRFDLENPIPPDSTVRLPGTIDGRENAWTVTSAGGREHFLLAVSPEAIPELESELASIPAADPSRPVEYAKVGTPAMEILRGVGGIEELPPDSVFAGSADDLLDRFRSLAGRERGVRGIWVRQIVFENPRP